MMKLFPRQKGDNAHRIRLESPKEGPGRMGLGWIFAFSGDLQAWNEVGRER